MVQVLTPRFQKKTTSQQFGEAFSRAAVGFTQHLAEKQKKEKEDEATARFLKEAYGIENTKGVPTDFLLQAQKGQQGINQQKAKYEEQGKQLQELGLDEEFGGAFSGNNQQSQNESEPDRLDRVNEQGEIKVGNVKVPTRKLIPESKIIKAARINPSVADKLQKHNDNIREQERHEENLRFQKETAQTKQVSESYKTNQKFIDKTYDQYEDSLRRDSILGRMNELEESGELSDSGIVNTLEGLGLKAEWLKNPSNEEYTKLGLDLLGGGTLQADYGSRVLQSEFMVSQQRIPTLSQTPEGRRQIAENIKTMLLPAKLKNDRMQYYLDRAERTGEPLPHDLRGKVLRDIKPQLEEAYDKFKQRNGRYPVKDGTVPDDNALEKYYFLSDGNQDKAFKMMKEDGYDVQPEGKRGISGGSARTRGR